MNLAQAIDPTWVQERMPDRAAPVRPVEAQPVRRRVNRQAQILELARSRGAISCRDVVTALGITNGNASVQLFTMCKAGRLRRAGEIGHYRYSAA